MRSVPTSALLLAGLPYLDALVLVPVPPPALAVHAAHPTAAALVSMPNSALVFPSEPVPMASLPSGLLLAERTPSEAAAQRERALNDFFAKTVPIIEDKFNNEFVPGLGKAAKDAEPYLKEAASQAEKAAKDAEPYLRKTADDLAPIAAQAAQVIEEDLGPALRDGLISLGKGLGAAAVVGANSAAVLATEAAKSAAEGLTPVVEQATADITGKLGANVALDEPTKRTLDDGVKVLAKTAEEGVKLAAPIADSAIKEATPYLKQASDTVLQTAGRAARDQVKGWITELDAIVGDTP